MIGANSAKSQNKKQMNAAQAQMDFQREMSDTAHQRQIKDLRKAGINPLLSASYGGASTPGGAMPQNLQNPGAYIADAVSSAGKLPMARQAQVAQIELLKQQQATEMARQAQSFASAEKMQAEADISRQKLPREQTYNLLWQKVLQGGHSAIEAYRMLGKLAEQAGYYTGKGADTVLRAHKRILTPRKKE